MTDIALSVQGLGKRYQIAHKRDPYGRLTESLWDAMRGPFDRLRGRPRETTEWIWALRDLSFDVRQGEVVGVIGRNGAGKTTLLKILSRITDPSAGTAELRGRVGSLLEVGTGFHQELTGRENVFMSGSILGMGRKEIDRKFDEIVDFSGIERFIDTPVKRYSSGMQVRLGFAVAAHMETEILIVDEVLAVGDVEFQRKCLAKMGDVSHEGRTILFVSHNMPAVESLCTSGMLLDQGQLIASGTANEVVEQYLSKVSELGSSDMAKRQDRQGTGALRFTSLGAVLRTGAESEIRLEYESEGNLRNVEIAIGIFSARGEGAAHLGTASTGELFGAPPARGAFVCRIPRTPLMPGSYVVNVFCTVNGEIADWIADAARVEVAEGDFYGTGKLPPTGYGSVLIEHGWTTQAR